MKTIKKSFDVYEFKELSAEAKDRAINDYVNFVADMYGDLTSDTTPNYVKKAAKQAETMSTPWFFTSYLYEYGRASIMKDLKRERYLKNGDVFNN